MLDFIKKSFRKIFEVFLWINLFAMTIGGGAIGYSLSSQIARPTIMLESPIAPSIVIIIIFTLLGVGIGLFVGVFTNIIGGGIVANILAMQQSLENMEKYLKFLAMEKKKQE